MNTAQLKNLLKRNGLTIAKERAVGFTRAAKAQGQGIRFDWKDVEGGHRCAHRSTESHTINETDQVLVLESVPREGVLTGPSDWAEAQADKDAETLAQVLKAAGLKYKRDGRAFTLSAFVRILEEGWGKRLHRSGARARSYKKAVYPDAIAA